MKTKMKWLSGLALGAVSFVVMGFGFLQAPVTAFANTATIQGVEISSFQMTYGASVRVDNDGIRFGVTMDLATYTALEALEKTTDTETVSVSYGVLITTNKYAKQAPLNEENVFGDNAYYNTFGTDASKATIVNATSSVMAQAHDGAEDSPVFLYGMITDAIDENADLATQKIFMQGKYVSCGYIHYEVKNAEGAVTEEQYVFADYATGKYDGDVMSADVSNNTRSMFQVALSLMQHGYEKSADVYAAYVSPVLGDYTVERYVGEVKDDETLSVTTNTDAVTVLDFLTKDGYAMTSLQATKEGADVVLKAIYASTTSAPVLTVTSETVEIDIDKTPNYDVMDGVSVTDVFDGADVDIEVDMGGWDGQSVGIYTLTYSATNSQGATATKTRELTVKGVITLEIPKDNINDKWTYGYGEKFGTDTTITFASDRYYPLKADTTSPNNDRTSVFHNVGTEPIVVSMNTVSGGETIILNKNGVVIEARDGANGHFVNADNPDRASGPATFTGVDRQTYTVSSEFAKAMQIPAGGMAIVVCGQYAYTSTQLGNSSTFNYDGREFVMTNLCGYGRVARVSANSVAMTEYQNHAPSSISGNSDVKVTVNGNLSQDSIDALVLQGLTVTDDNGTFGADDDTTDVTITITDRGNLNVATAGTYTYTLTATDKDGLSATFTRKVVVSSTVTVTVGTATTEYDRSKVAVNETIALSNYASYGLVIYTKAYTEDTLPSAQFGIAVIIDQTGAIVRVYNGAYGTDGVQYDSNHPEGETITNLNKTYVTTAFASLQDGEIMIVAPNDGSTNTNRNWWVENACVIGKVISLSIEVPQKANA